MEFSPIAGINAVTLLNVQKPDRVGPHFQVEDSARAGDEPDSSSQQAPDRGLEEEDDAEILEQAASENEPEQSESESDGSLNWFV
jgi:hypothetical protein